MHVHVHPPMCMHSNALAGRCCPDAHTVHVHPPICMRLLMHWLRHVLHVCYTSMCTHPMHELRGVHICTYTCATGASWSGFERSPCVPGGASDVSLRVVRAYKYAASSISSHTPSINIISINAVPNLQLSYYLTLPPTLQLTTSANL